MIVVEFNRITGPQRIFHAKITCGAEGITNIASKLLSFGNMVIGSDEAEKEMVLYPGNFTISFCTDTLADYYTAMNQLKTDDAIIFIRENDSAGDIVFKGKSKYESIDGDPMNRTITLTFYDDFKQLSERFIQPGDEEVDYYTLEEMIYETLGIDFDAVEIVTDMLFQYKDGASHYDFPISEFAFHRKNKFYDFKQLIDDDPVTYFITYHFENKGQVLISLLNQFASLGVLGLNRTFYIVPRFYSGGAVINVKKAECKDDKFKTSFTKQFLGMKLYCHSTDVFYADYDYGTVLPIPGTYEEFDLPETLDRIFVPAAVSDFDESGTDPGYAVAVRRKDSLGTLYSISKNYCKYKKADGTYSTTKSLQAWIGNLIFSNIQGARKKYFVERTGTDYNFTQFFTIEGETNKFRPVKISYNFMEDSTELTLIECPDITEYTPV